MYNLLVFLVLTTSVGQFKCQDWISFPRRNAGCPQGTQLDVATDTCVITVKLLDNGCPGGTRRNDNDECDPIGLRRVAAPEAFKAGCIPGTSRDPYTGECVSCPPGSERDGDTNECVVILDTDKRRLLVVGCPDGYIRNDKGKCVPIRSRRVASPEAFKAGCIPGTSRDPYTGECVSCPPGSERDGATNECVVILDTDKRRHLVIGCPDGYVRNDKGKCVPIGFRRVAAPEAFKAGCIPGTSRDPYTGECVSCPPGSERDGATNECVVILDTDKRRHLVVGCRDGYIRNDKGKCVPIGLRRVAAPDVVEGGCIPGTSRDPNTGECVSCPPGSERDGATNECVVILDNSRRLLGNMGTHSTGLRRVAAPDVVEGGCIPGTSRDPNTGECVSCPPGSERDGATNECVLILDNSRRLLGNMGTHPTGLRRVAAPDVVEGGCIPGTSRDPNTGECVSCPPGSERDGATNECVVILDNSRRLLGNMGTHPTGLRREAAPDAVEDECIPGTTRDPTTGECVSCPPGSERDDATNECVVFLDKDRRSLLSNIGKQVMKWIVKHIVTYNNTSKQPVEKIGNFSNLL